jgi:tetratricopeptide (TPR) repeat protein
MKSLLFASLTLGLSVGVAAELPWAKDYPSAVDNAKRSNKLMMVCFYVDGDSDWRKWTVETFVDSRVVRLCENIVPVKLNAESDGESLSKRFKLEAYPTILFVDALGETWGEVSGYLAADEFAAELMPIVQNHRAYPAIAAKLKSDPTDGEANARMAQICASRKRMDEAEAHLEAAERSSYRGVYLARALLAIGDRFQLSSKQERAIPFFKRAHGVATTGEDRSYALLALAYCYLHLEDKESARRYCNLLIEMEDASTDYVEMARRILRSLGSY